ncbi:MAG TPA: flagellar hook-length control protein FliK [Calditerricola sp.]
MALPAELVAAADDAGQPIAGEAPSRPAAGVPLEGRLPQGLPAGTDGAERSAFAGHEESVERPMRAGDEEGPGRLTLGNDGAMPRSAHRGRADDPVGNGVTGEGRPLAPLSADAVRFVPTPRNAGGGRAASAGDPVPVERFAEQAAPALLRALHMNASGQTAEVRLLLVPEQLGKVDVQLAVHNGRVTIAFAVDTSAAKEALESQIPQLRWQLEQQGLVLDKVSVTQGTSGGLAFFHGFSHGHRGALPYPHTAPRRAHAAYGGEETVESLPTGSIRAGQARISRVDYSV